VLRLRRDYGKLGLTAEQRDSVLQVQSKYGAQIADLQKKIEKLREEEMAEVRDILNRDQKEHLDKIRAEREAAKAKADAVAAENEKSNLPKKANLSEEKLKAKEAKQKRDSAAKEEKAKKEAEEAAKKEEKK
jgi:hypothetical protein